MYELDETEMAEALGSEKLAVKLVDELQRSTNAPLNVLLAAFSIPLIGKTAADKLSKVCIDIDEIDYDICREAGLGEKSTASLLHWLEMEFYQVSMLPFNFKFVRSSNTIVNTSANTVCITGKLLSYKTKAEAHAALEAVGLNVKSSLTKDVTILVNESGIESAKTKKARDAGVQIVTNLKILTGE